MNDDLNTSGRVLNKIRLTGLSLLIGAVLAVVAIVPDEVSSASAPPASHVEFTTRVTPTPWLSAQPIGVTPASTGEVAVGTLAAIHSIGAIAFASSARGYGLATVAGSTYPVVTTNGGKTWRVVGDALYRSTLPPTDEISALSVESNGEVIAYPGSGTGSVIDFSSDGGREWWRTSFSGSSIAVGGHGSTLYVVVNRPQSPNEAATFSPPQGWLYLSSSGGLNFRYEAMLPSDIGSYAVVVVPSASTAYALAPGEKNALANLYGGLAKTTDGGAKWTSVVAPCSVDGSPRYYGYAQFGAGSTGDLWMVCGQHDLVSHPILSNVAQVMYSDDGARSWLLIAGTELVEPPGQYNFPAIAGVPLAGSTGMSIFGATDIWLVLVAPDTLLRTTDGGATWALAAPKTIEAQGPQQAIAVNGTVIVRTKVALWSYGSTGRWK